MAQEMIETEQEPTEGAAPMECQHCGDEIPGQPFYRMSDTIRNEAGEFVPTADADAFCDVTCQRQFETTEATDA